MARRKPYELIYDPDVREQALQIGRKYHSLIRQEIEARLSYEPETETGNRKPLLRPSALGSAWELRCGPDNPFRVFYRTDRARRRVHILAVGVKIRDRLVIGREEFDL